MIHLFSLGKHAPGFTEPGGGQPHSPISLFRAKKRKEVGVGKQGAMPGKSWVIPSLQEEEVRWGLSAVFFRETNCPLIGRRNEGLPTILPNPRGSSPHWRETPSSLF